MSTLLSVNNYHYPRGGAEVVFLEHNRLFQSIGWDVVPFAMQHPENLASSWSDYWVDEIELGHDYSFFDKLKKVPKTVYSLEARRRVRQIVEKAQPDIAHCHNIYHHISPSILRELKSLGIPCVMTLHDLKIACPSYKMLTHDGICERCKGGALRNVVINKCVKQSTALSALVWLESQLHRFINTYADCVDAFVVPSHFYLEKFVEWGWPREKFCFVPNFVDADKLTPEYQPGEAFAYFGRLAEEKGLSTLVQATAKAGAKLKIAGTGPLESELKKLAADLNAQVEFVGYLSGESLHDFVRQARAVILPSEWYENAPLSVMEAYSLGKSVIGANVGGIPELIKSGETGEVFEMRSIESLALCLQQYSTMTDLELAGRGRAGRDWMAAEFSPDVYRERITNLYSSFAAPKTVESFGNVIASSKFSNSDLGGKLSREFSNSAKASNPMGSNLDAVAIDTGGLR